MVAPVEYSQSYCDTKHENVDKEFSHVCHKVDELRDTIKTLNNRLWFGLVAIVVNILVAGIKTMLSMNWGH